MDIPVASAETVFNVLSPSDGKAYLILLIIMSLCLGALTMDLFNHLRFDYRLVTKPGWSKPAILASRSAYLCCRYLSVVVMTLILCFPLLKLGNCTPIPLVYDILAMFLLDSVAYIFVSRTMALYSFKRKVCVPLGIFFGMVLIAAALCIPNYGEGVRIEGTEFCLFVSHKHLTRTKVINITYKTLSMTLDLTLLLLTLHRLLEGGLASIFNTKRQRFGANNLSLSGFLIRQGFHFYALQFGTDVFLITAYFSFPNEAYKDLGTILGFCIPPIVASKAFREIGKKAHEIGIHNARQINEIVTDSASGIRPTKSGAASRPAAPAMVVTSAAPMRDQDGVGTQTITRQYWDGRRTFDHGRADLTGIVVTHGVVSRIDEGEWGRDAQANDQYEMKRQWSGSAAKSDESIA
ncbi:hypothetical protein PHSY_005790 [Pseudozyma hubeiensis SY62]|uniref:Uncharacterized protein n=1 Tax=Pseudozyma hubeiensis (strain SY62) TaxID=1305764 RepID=R9PA02_PSEHS|nr:hypothetical protein PHSY_005790 [Pseudozyma hubeiensis SY62]GAC98201.1 hypothetical protein PHSY_005790 [Pseudozyma hubeiensis SY62]